MEAIHHIIALLYEFHTWPDSNPTHERSKTLVARILK